MLPDRKKGAGTHSLTAGKGDSAPCLCIKNGKKKEFVDIVLSYCDNMGGIKTSNYSFSLVIFIIFFFYVTINQVMPLHKSREFTYLFHKPVVGKNVCHQMLHVNG
jgi:hypothetical protein